ALRRDPRAVPSALSRSFAAILGARRFALPRLARAARLAQGAWTRAEGRTRSSDQVVQRPARPPGRFAVRVDRACPADRRMGRRRLNRAAGIRSWPRPQAADSLGADDGRRAI